MRIIERDIRMAGFEYRDKDAKITYGTISSPLTIKDSGNKCCDEVTVIYDYFDEESKKAERIRIRYWAGLHTSNKGSRHRLYKQKDILGQNKKILAKPKLGSKDVMADYIEDLQIVNIENNGLLYSGFHQTNHGINVHDPKNKKNIGRFSFGVISALAFGPDGLLYSGHEGNNYIGIYDVNAKKYVGDFNANTRISALAFDSDGLLYSGFHQENYISVHDPKNKKNIGRFSFGKVSALAFGPDGLLYAGHEGSPYIGIYDVNAKKHVDSFDAGTRISALAFGSDGLLYYGFRHASHGINVHDPKNKKNIGRFSFGVISALAFGPDGLLYSGHEGQNYIGIYDVNAKKYVGDFNANTRISALVAKNKRTGQESLVNISLTLRTKNQYGKDRQFKKKDYHSGNYKLDKTDKYKRDTFSSTVLVRNLAL
jgi:hypothetical protein